MKKIIATIMLFVVLFPNSVFGADSGSASVFLEVGAYCGNNYIDSGEECDGTLGVPGTYICNNCELEKINNAINPPQAEKGFVMLDVSWDVGKLEATVFWKTNKPAFGEFSWGETDSLEKETIYKTVEAKEHSVFLEDLWPGKMYFFQIVARDINGKELETKIYSFRTDIAEDLDAPANVSDFTATAEEESIFLEWENPIDDDFRAVKIIRSEEFFPADLDQGVEVYNGNGESFRDFDVEPGKQYYYTAFSYDNNGNYSSGAIATAIIEIEKQDDQKDDDKDVDDEPKDKEEDEDEDGLPDFPKAPIEEQIDIDFNDFEFFVANGQIKLESSGIKEFLPGSIVDVRTRIDNYPQVLKTILVSIFPKNKSGKAKNYILRADKEKVFYKSQFLAPSVPEDYNIYVYYVNFKNRQIAKAESDMSVKKFGILDYSSFENFFIKTAQAEGTDKETPDRLYGAEITLYGYENGKFQKWEGMEYSQFNPMLSNPRGQYGFLVPNGYYFLRVRKDGFDTHISLPFEVKNHLINQDVNLIYYPKLNLVRFILLLFVSLVVISFLNKNRRVKRVNKGV